MGKDLTIPVTLDEMQPILEHLAIASHYSHEAWLHLEATLPLAREACPEFYEALTKLMLRAYRQSEEVDGQGDGMVDDLNLREQVAALEAAGRPLVAAPLIGMQ